MIDREDLIRKLMLLSEQLWEGRVNRQRIDNWLTNFTGLTTEQRTERDHALLLLSNVMYFGERELRELLRALFRDHYRYRLIQEIRRRLGGTTDVEAIHKEYHTNLKRTRFLPMGNPSESGTHLLYWFRQENGLPRDLFLHPYELSNISLADPAAALANPDIRRLVFLDDFCGSGTQAATLARSLLPLLRRLATNSQASLDISYLVLFAHSRGITHVRRYTSFDSVETVFELDRSYKAFSPSARQFAATDGTASKNIARRLAFAYGRRLYPRSPLGFKNSQLLLAFHHNTPDNSLPILWAGPPEHPAWHPILHRYPKYYGNKPS